METWDEKVGIWIASFGLGFPGLIIAGFFPAWNVLPLAAWVSLSAGACAIGMAFASSDFRVAGFCGGLIGGICIPFTLALYVYFRAKWSATFFSVELLIPGLIGAIPGFAACALVKHVMNVSETPPVE